MIGQEEQGLLEFGTKQLTGWERDDQQAKFFLTANREEEEEEDVDGGDEDDDDDDYIKTIITDVMSNSR